MKNYFCLLSKIGGNDQTGNIYTGYELITKTEPKNNIFGLTIPIITTEKGEKLGKSAGNAIWLDAALLSPFEFYQFFVNTADQMVETYLKIFTFHSLAEIAEIMNKHNVKWILLISMQSLKYFNQI